MKKIFLILILIFFGLGNIAFAETGKNLNWCNTDTKIKYPFYIHGKGKIKKHKSTDALENAKDKIVIIIIMGVETHKNIMAFVELLLKILQV